MNFCAAFREERYYCNHFFRLLCEGLGSNPEESGLAKVLSRLGVNGVSPADIRQAEIYAEVAAFRDAFHSIRDKAQFLEELYDLLLPTMQRQYNGLIATPPRPGELRSQLGMFHPSKCADFVNEPEFEKSDVLFYREFGALYNAKPDFLILVSEAAIWIEAKCDSSFSNSQIQRMRNIGALCETKLFDDFFRGRRPRIALLGSRRRHAKAQTIANTTFISWEDCADIAVSVFPAGPSDITSRALMQVASS